MLRESIYGIRVSSFVLLLAACVPCVAAHPDEPVGTWNIQSFCPDGKTRSCIVTVSREDAGLRANYVVDGTERAAKDVIFEGGILSIEVDGEFGGQAYGLTYKGKPAKGKIKGTATWSYQWFSGTFDFEGERVQREVVATRRKKGFAKPSLISSFVSKSLLKVKAWKRKSCEAVHRFITGFSWSRICDSLRSRLRSWRARWTLWLRGCDSVESLPKPDGLPSWWGAD